MNTMTTSLVILWTFSGILTPFVAGFLLANKNPQEPLSSRRQSKYVVFSKTISSSPLSTSSSLDHLTVQHLKDMIKESGLEQERGLWSKLKRKQDMIDYIMKQNIKMDVLDIDSVCKSAEEGSSSSIETEVHHRTIQEHLESHDADDKNENYISDSSLNLPREIASTIPNDFQDRLVQQRGINMLLPSQIASFTSIYEGRDTVLQAPTGSGKTLAYGIPLVLVVQSQQQQTQRSPQPRVASPLILTLAPSRELAKQIGKEWAKLLAIGGGSITTEKKKNSLVVATVFGGVPLERHIALLKEKPKIVVGTPGRVRELFREGFLDYSQLTTLVMDEADTLLDKSDSPEVQAILRDIEANVINEEYQLVLVSATINQNVKDFTDELGISRKAYIRVEEKSGSESSSDASTIPHANSDNRGAAGTGASKVQHWSLSCKASARTAISANLISIWNPRLAIVFVPTKSETESIALFLSTRFARMGVHVLVLHGDMSQTARTRAIQTIRENASSTTPQILVATDVASRGLDLPNVDLVLQFGVPRIAGKDGTFSSELYIHRTGRAGRMGKNYPQDRVLANSVLLYDPAVGEAKLLPDLAREIKNSLNVEILHKSIPTALEVVEASYKRTRNLVFPSPEVPAAPSITSKDELASYFRSQLENEETLDKTNPDQLLECLASAMAMLAGLDPSMSSVRPQCSLLTGMETERTLRLVHHDTPLSPPAVTHFCKSMGSGKLGRVILCRDGSAVFDLPVDRATKLITAVASSTSRAQFQLEIPLTMPEID